MFYFIFQQNMLVHLFRRPSEVYIPQLHLIEDPWGVSAGDVKPPAWMFPSKRSGEKTQPDSAERRTVEQKLNSPF